MCGRTRMARSPAEVERLAGAHCWTGRERYRPTSNLCPGRQSPVVHRGPGGANELTSMHFGLIPSYTAKDEKLDFWRLANARSESVAQLPTFSRCLARRRCCVLIDGFYEWHAEHMGKQPFYQSSNEPEEGKEGEPPLLWLAGLYDTWVDAEGKELQSYTLLTADIAPQLGWLHTRMPVILGPAAAERWLDVVGTAPEAALCSANPTCNLRWHKVHPRMSKAQYAGDDAHIPYSPPEITSFFKAQTKPGAKADASAENKAGPTGTAKESVGVKVEASAKLPSFYCGTELRPTEKADAASAGSGGAKRADEGRTGGPRPDAAPSPKRAKAAEPPRSCGGGSGSAHKTSPKAAASGARKAPPFASPKKATPADPKQRSIASFFGSKPN
mmetsp:Transcript_30219/g.74436  ORF Transcript_30219/g.74436 Transcript_30219/m.74436 type:complete len:386 (+) Transcript_30219:82-1239(+)